MFIDKKKFNLDRSDDLNFYWRDPSKIPEIFSTCQQGGGSAIAYGVIFYRRTLSMMRIRGDMGSKHYCEILEQAIIPSATHLFGVV